MTTKTKALLSTGAIAICLLAATSFSGNLRANNRVVKYAVFHNGHILCLPAPAVRAHMREHETDVELGCCDNCAETAD